MINYHIKGYYKTICCDTKSKFSQFFFSHWLLHKCFFSFLIKAFANFEKLIRFHWQAFIVYKNGENLKILIEIFCQKLIVSSVILAFLNHWNLNFSSTANEERLLFRISGSAPEAIPSVGFGDLLDFDFLIIKRISSSFIFKKERISSGFRFSPDILLKILLSIF